MKRTFIKQSDINLNTVNYTDANFHYLKNVLRVKMGEKIEAIIEGGTESYITSLEQIGQKEITGRVIEKITNQPKTPLIMTVIQGLPKSQKMEFILQKCTEIGANNFYPLISLRTVPDIKDKKDKKIARWQTICKEAAKQCRRNDIPQVFDPINIKDLETIYQAHDLNIILWEEESKTSIKSILTSHHPKSISITIGPEGGLSNAEVTTMKAYGGIPAGLGDNILRTETAPIAICAMLAYEYLL